MTHVLAGPDCLQWLPGAARVRLGPQWTRRSTAETPFRWRRSATATRRCENEPPAVAQNSSMIVPCMVTSGCTTPEQSTADPARPARPASATPRPHQPRRNTNDATMDITPTKFASVEVRYPWNGLLRDRLTGGTQEPLNALLQRSFQPLRPCRGLAGDAPRGAGRVSETCLTRAFRLFFEGRFPLYY
jgi:hypothetical protein